jgi:hypothetical protein
VEEGSALCGPEYSNFIPPMERRRMSAAVKNAIVCAKDCVEQSGNHQPDAIIVGTGLGCSLHTSNFLEIIANANGGLMSPTSFTLSTTNTIAGQISLALNNQGYNNTHSQNSLSFEHALLDAQMCLDEGLEEVLVGVSEEWEDKLYDMMTKFQMPSTLVSQGASFFTMSPHSKAQNAVEVVAVEAYSLCSDVQKVIAKFVQDNNKLPVDLVLVGSTLLSDLTCLADIFPNAVKQAYLPWSGLNLGAGGFALSMATDLLLNGEGSDYEHVNQVLICNNIIPENLGLVLLRKVTS